ncbi:hypothetical protein Tco_0309124 [Tanacetum coccineum]
MLGAGGGFGVHNTKNNLDGHAFMKRGRLEHGIMVPQDLLGLGVSLSRVVGFLRGTSAVVVILVKGHVFPTIVKVRPIACDPLALVDSFTPLEDNIGLLETRFDEEAVFVFMFLFFFPPFFPEGLSPRILHKQNTELVWYTYKQSLRIHLEDFVIFLVPLFP